MRYGSYHCDRIDSGHYIFLHEDDPVGEITRRSGGRWKCIDGGGRVMRTAVTLDKAFSVMRKWYQGIIAERNRIENERRRAERKTGPRDALGVFTALMGMSLSMTAQREHALNERQEQMRLERRKRNR